MWMLTHTTTKEQRYLLTEKGKYSVGRALADIPLAGDNSISRVHAIIHVSVDAVHIEDSGSKYGVYLNANDIAANRALPKNELATMRVGDIVRFGRLENVWLLERIVINCCTSTVDAGQMAELVEVLHTVNGTVQREWGDCCTHLVMPNVTVTIKVLQALVQGVPIVTPAYWAAYVECARQHQPLPNVKDFVPEINEQFLRKNPEFLHVNLSRQRLFQGKKFVFMSKKHMKAYEGIINMANGECHSVDEGHFVNKDMLRKEIIPVQYKVMGESQATQSIHKLIGYIEKHGRRAINESELSLAILHRSIERYCNPDYKMQKAFEVETYDLTVMAGKVIVEETPESRAQEAAGPQATEVVLPESIDLTEDAGPSRPIESSAVYSEFVEAGHFEMDMQNVQLEQPSTSGLHLGKRSRHRVSYDEEAVIEQSVEKRPKPNDDVPTDVGRTSPTESSQSSSFCGFTTTQNRLNRSHAPTQVRPAEPQSQQTQIDAAERRKRVIEELKALSDSEDNNNDTDENPFKFGGRRPAKRQRTNRMDLPERANGCDDGEEDNGGFNFSHRMPQRGRGRASQQKPEATESSAAETSVLVPFNRSIAENSNRMSFIQPIKASNIGWLSRAFNKDMSLGENSNKEPAPLPGGIKIKEEKLEEWEMTSEEKKQKWLKSLVNAIEVKTFDVTIARRSTCSAADETDGNLSVLDGTSVRNFKKFVKKRNYIPQTNVVRTNPVNITINPYARV